jgi:hypothetical protein
VEPYLPTGIFEELLNSDGEKKNKVREYRVDTDSLTISAFDPIGMPGSRATVSRDMPVLTACHDCTSAKKVFLEWLVVDDNPAIPHA